MKLEHNQLTALPESIGQLGALQFLILGLKEVRARLVSLLVPYYTDRTFVRLYDGERLALDWVDPIQYGKAVAPYAPIVVLLHGAFQGSESATMIDMAVDLARRGLPCVVMNRRGYESVAFAKLAAALGRW